MAREINHNFYFFRLGKVQSLVVWTPVVPFVFLTRTVRFATNWIGQTQTTAPVLTLSLWHSNSHSNSSRNISLTSSRPSQKRTRRQCGSPTSLWRLEIRFLTKTKASWFFIQTNIMNSTYMLNKCIMYMCSVNILCLCEINIAKT